MFVIEDILFEGDAITIAEGANPFIELYAAPVAGDDNIIIRVYERQHGFAFDLEDIVWRRQGEELATDLDVLGFFIRDKFHRGSGGNEAGDRQADEAGVPARAYIKIHISFASEQPIKIHVIGICYD